MLAIERRGRVLVATLACAPVNAIDAALPARLDARMMERKSGRIVNIAVDAGRVGCRRWRPASVCRRVADAPASALVPSCGGAATYRNRQAAAPEAPGPAPDAKRAPAGIIGRKHGTTDPLNQAD
jgi:hypothetical protein